MQRCSVKGEVQGWETEIQQCAAMGLEREEFFRMLGFEIWVLCFVIGAILVKWKVKWDGKKWGEQPRTTNFSHYGMWNFYM
jgi:hypothetical protein